MTERATLTDVEAIALDAVKGYIESKGYPPTVQEVADLCGYASKSTAHELLHRLARKGWLRVDKSPRAIVVLE